MEKYTELQQYRIDYISKRKAHIIKRLEEIKNEDENPGILYEDHKRLMAEKEDLIKEFDSLSEEYREIVQAAKLYRFHVAKALELEKKWGFSNEKN